MKQRGSINISALINFANSVRCLGVETVLGINGGTACDSMPWPHSEKGTISEADQPQLEDMLAENQTSLMEPACGDSDSPTSDASRNWNGPAGVLCNPSQGADDKHMTPQQLVLDVYTISTVARSLVAEVGLSKILEHDKWNEILGILENFKCANWNKKGTWKRILQPLTMNGRVWFGLLRKWWESVQFIQRLGSPEFENNPHVRQFLDEKYADGFCVAYFVALKLLEEVE